MENVAIPGNFVFRERWPLVVETPGCLQDCLLPVQCTVMCVAAQGKAHELRTVGKNYVLRMIERLIQVALFSYFAYVLRPRISGKLRYANMRVLNKKGI